MNIQGNKVVLRAIDTDDVIAIHKWANDPEVQRGLGGWHFPLSKTALQSWIQTFKHDGTDQRFIIELASKEAIGMVTLTSINWKDRNAIHGVMVAESSQRRKGFAADAVLTLMRYAFEELGMKRLDTTIVEYNQASLLLHIDKCGWVEEGRKEGAVFRGNRYWSNVVLGITREQYAQHMARQPGRA